MPDPLFQTLFEETEAVTWAPIAEVRDRARRRVLRTRMTAVTAAVVAVGVVFGGVAAARLYQNDPQPGISPPVAWPTPTPVPPPTALPSSAPSASPVPTPPPTSDGTAIVDALFLRPGDVGPGYRLVVDTDGSGDWVFGFTAAVLGCPQPDPALQPIARRERTLSRGTPEAEDRLAQSVARYRPGDAARYLDQVRARVAACRPGSGRSIEVVAQRFAGQDALLVQVDYGDGFTTKHVLVRQGDLLTEFWTKPERRGAAAQELGRKAALRLCAGTSAC